MTTGRWILLIIVLAVASGMRIWKLETLPDGFFCDEASLGYNAWSISHFGIDETGNRFPLYARSLGVKKNPVFVYASMIPIRIFGLSAMSVRMTSAVFGVLTIAGVFWLVYLIQGFVPGLLASIFLTLLPWNFHFSRIAFELITWPCVFIWGFAFLFFAIRRGGWPWLAAGLLMGISLHSYVMAITFVPIFLPLVGLIYIDRLVKHARWMTAGLILFILLAIPAVQHHSRTRASEHYSYIGWWTQAKDQPLQAKLIRLAESYVPFFQTEFLVKIGDPNPRHSIRNHGPIYQSLFYLSIAGLITGLLPPSRIYWVLLIWTALYPLGTALTIDRYATRSIIGSPLAPIWAACATGWLLKLIDRIRLQLLSRIIRYGIIAAVLLFVGRDAVPYFRRYVTEYNGQAAHGLYGFQYGYKETIRFMESRRPEFPQMILTAHNVNEPYIFCLFYNRLDPDLLLKTHDFGYKITRSYDYRNYTLDQPTLIAIHPDEIVYFDSYKLHHTVKGYNEQIIFYIIEPLALRPAFDKWAVRGLRRRMPHEGCSGDYFDPAKEYPKPINSLTGPVLWTCPEPRPPVVDLQWHFMNSDPEHPFNPEYTEAEGVCWTSFDHPVSGHLELFGSHDFFSMWLNGQQILEPRLIETEKVTRIPFEATAGWNEWAFRACEGFGDWYFVMTLRDSQEGSLVPSRIRIAPPGLDDRPLLSEDIADQPADDNQQPADDDQQPADDNQQPAGDTPP